VLCGLGVAYRPAHALDELHHGMIVAQVHGPHLLVE
jgi:hypothetical protein